MKSLTRFITLLCCLTFGAALTQAQAVSDKQQDAPAANTIAQDVLIIIQHEQVRFTSRSPGAEMQLRIFDQAGQLIHDSGTV